MHWPERLAAGLVVAALAGGCVRPVGESVLTPSRSGHRRVGAVRRFSAETLYDHINGEAPFVVSFGFRSLAHATYGGGEDAPVFSVDLYDMGCAANAFALFRARSSVEAQPLDLGTEGAGDETRADFWQGRFYASVAALPGAEGRSALPVARDLARDLPAGAGWPEYLQLLPVEHRVARSEQYAPADFLGHEFLRRAVSARYRVEGREALLFACRYDSVDEASRALARLEAALQERRPARADGLGEGGFVADDPVLGRLAVFRRGRFLGGMTRHADDAATAGLLAELDRRLLRAERAGDEK